jgi:hypothetical protein
MSNLQVTYGQFVVKGIVTGLTNENAFTEGQKEGGNPWKKVQFGVKTSNTEFVYVELMGSKSKDVQFAFRDPDTKKKDNKNTKKVVWADRYKDQNNFEIQMPIKAGLERDDKGKKLKDNKSLVPYDAVDYAKKYLKDGESVYIRGALQISDYKGNAQEKYMIQQIYVTNEPVDFDADGFLKEASFNQDIVYVGSEDDSKSGKTFIEANIIYKKDQVINHVPYFFVVDAEKYKSDKEKHPKVLNLIKSFKNLPFGSTIKVNGNINNGVILVKDDTVVDDFGGFDAEGQGDFIKDRIKELEITNGDGTTLTKAFYKKEDFESPFNNQTGSEVDIEDEDLPF